MDETIRVTSAGGVELDYEVAGLGGRSFAFIIDWHIRIILALAWFLPLNFLVFNSFDSSVIAEVIDDSKTMAMLFIFLVLLPTFVIYFLYHPLLELMMSGRTPGKRMAGVRVISKEGSAASAGAILVRNVFRLLDSFPGGLYFLGIMAAMFNKKNLRLGDLAAGTVLIYEQKSSRRGIEELIGGEQSSGLSTRQRELAIELSERWTQLDSNTRVELAEKLLTRLGYDTHQDAQWTRRDALLQEALKVVGQGGRQEIADNG
ncbi:MAG: RDD family protein [Thiohalophilus sp.]